jgi:hypothetical protein
MKSVRTPDCNVTLTLPGGTQDNDLPAQRAMLYDTTAGETQEDARLGFVSRWLPDEREARKLEAGAAIELTIWGAAHPPVAVSVTDAVVPERELVQRGRVERALGQLYADLKERAARELVSIADAMETGALDPDPAIAIRKMPGAILPSPATFADLWTNALDATREDHERAERAWRIIDPRRSNGHDTAG